MSIFCRVGKRTRFLLYWSYIYLHCDDAHGEFRPLNRPTTSYLPSRTSCSIAGGAILFGWFLFHFVSLGFVPNVTFTWSIRYGESGNDSLLWQTLFELRPDLNRESTKSMCWDARHRATNTYPIDRIIRSQSQSLVASFLTETPPGDDDDKVAYPGGGGGEGEGSALLRECVFVWNHWNHREPVDLYCFNKQGALGACMRVLVPYTFRIL